MSEEASKKLLFVSKQKQKNFLHFPPLPLAYRSHTTAE